jgi:hypothetical protein
MEAKDKGFKKHKFTLKDLQTKFKKHEVITMLQCAGKRREDLHNERMRESLAPHWVVGAISTAKWGGVKVRDVIREGGQHSTPSQRPWALSISRKIAPERPGPDDDPCIEDAKRVSKDMAKVSILKRERQIIICMILLRQSMTTL